MNTITREVTASTRITTYHCITASRHRRMDESGFGLDKLHENYIWYMVYIYKDYKKNYIDNLYSTEIGKHRVCISYMVFVHKQSEE